MRRGRREEKRRAVEGWFEGANRVCPREGNGTCEGSGGSTDKAGGCDKSRKKIEACA